MVMIILAVVVALGGLFISSHAADDTFHYTGLVLFVAAILWLFSVIGASRNRR